MKGPDNTYQVNFCLLRSFVAVYYALAYIPIYPRIQLPHTTSSKTQHHHRYKPPYALRSLRFTVLRFTPIRFATVQKNRTVYKNTADYCMFLEIGWTTIQSIFVVKSPNPHFMVFRVYCSSALWLKVLIKPKSLLVHTFIEKKIF